MKVDGRGRRSGGCATFPICFQIAARSRLISVSDAPVRDVVQYSNEITVLLYGGGGGDKKHAGRAKL